MVFIHIDTKNYQEKDVNGKTQIDNLNSIIHGDKNNTVFILYYMEGCGPCNATRPEWEKLKNVLKNVSGKNDIAIVDIDQALSSKIKSIKQPSSFPTIRFITDGGNEVENYEDSKLRDEEKDRSIDSFVKWIQLKSGKQNVGYSNNQKGGILINSKDAEAFNHFIQNSTFTYLSKGAFGITFKATLKPGIVSQYRHLESSTKFDYGDEVRTIIIKLGFVHDASIGEKENLAIIKTLGEFSTGELQTFKDEVNIQTDIFLKTMNYLQPMCPAIVYSSIYKDIVGENRLTELLETMFNGAENRDTQNLIKEIYDSKKKREFYNIGLIGMEFADGYVLLHNLKKNSNFELYKNMTLYLLLKLAMDTGYTHGDFHPGNIFINVNCNNYFKNTTGKPLLIDFGQSQKIPLEILTFMKEQYKNGNYTESLKKLCDIVRPDGIEMEKYPSFYGFACGTYDYKNNKPITGFSSDVNSDIASLVLKREQGIDDMVTLFKTKHDSQPDKYPLLPLSNSVKNAMFEGLITGGKIHKKKRMKKQSMSKTRKNKTNKRSKKYGGKWSLKYKRSINCKTPKGFSQKQYCKYKN